MSELRVNSVRSDVTETTHEIAAAVVDADGLLVASSGDPNLVTPMRSAAKPFQALPLVEDGVIERFAISRKELALACASHNSELHQVVIVRQWMDRLDLSEDQLVCGPHRPLAKDLGFRRHDGTWDEVELASPSRSASNCSGKHTGMLALAKLHGWTEEGYEVAGHPVQDRCRSAIGQACGVPERAIGAAVDGCGVVSWSLSLRAMAAGYARLSHADGAMGEIVTAMTTHPDLVAGKRRLCTALMGAYPGRIVAKVGAGGVYGAALIEERLGIAIKVIDGDHIAAAVALLAILDRLGLQPPAASVLPEFARPIILNTNRKIVGSYRPNGSISLV